MKKIMIIATLVSGFAVLTAFNSTSNVEIIKTETIATSDFCEGWEEGYCEGWKDVKGQLALCPLTPLCPLPKLGQDSYKGGYNRGFKAGMKAARK